jgi:ribosomal protein S18 acetylase RimI-like enzyme
MSEDLPDLTFRDATAADLPAIVAMLADDALGRERESPDEPLLPSYYETFAAIERDPNNSLIVAYQDDAVVGALQLSFMPSISYRGSWRATIENVRTSNALRGRGIGRALIEHAIARARAHGCRIVQLTTDKRRTDALRFYERLGFAASHEGMKLHLVE